MAGAANFDTLSFSSEQQAMLGRFRPKDAIVKARADVDAVDLVIYEKFRVANGVIGSFVNNPNDPYNCQAFAVNITKTGDCKPAMLVNGKIRYVECLINNQDTVEVRVKEGFVHSGKIINSIAIVYFKDQGRTYYLTLNGKKAPGGSLEETDMKDKYRELVLAEALCKASLREFAEEILALDKKQAKEMGDSQIVQHIRVTTKCKEAIECQVLINENLERLPQKEFNDLMLSAPVMIDLGTCSLEIMQKALVKEMGSQDIPQIIDEETALNPKEFRNAIQVAFHKANPKKGISLLYFSGEPS